MVEKGFLGKTNSMGEDLEFRNIHVVFERLKRPVFLECGKLPEDKVWGQLGLWGFTRRVMGNY